MNLASVFSASRSLRNSSSDPDLAAFSDAGEGGSAGVRALVNLGGVLVTVQKLDEAWVYNAYRAFC